MQYDQPASCSCCHAFSAMMDCFTTNYEPKSIPFPLKLKQLRSKRGSSGVPLCPSRAPFRDLKTSMPVIWNSGLNSLGSNGLGQPHPSSFATRSTYSLSPGLDPLHTCSFPQRASHGPDTSNILESLLSLGSPL